MATIPVKQANQTGKSTDEADSHGVCLAHRPKLAKSLEVPSVVTPVAALYAHVSTSSSKQTLTPTSSTSSLASTTSMPVSSTPSSNLSTAFAAKLSAVIMKSPPTGVKKKAVYIDSCDSAQVKTECFKYIKNAADLPIDQQSRISFFVRKFNSIDIIAAFSMIIGKVAGAALTAFFPLPMKKEDLIQQFLCLIYDIKSMIYRYVRAKYSYSQ
jgi:hypothetical protein